MNRNSEKDSPNYTVAVDGNALFFSSAHFITYDGGRCESLHGHNYRVSVSVEGTLGESALVLDFLTLRDHMAGIIEELDHSLLLPENNPHLEVAEENGTVVVRHEERSYAFPARDVVIVPVPNTTAEMIAGHLVETLADTLGEERTRNLTWIEVEVEESPGLAASRGLAP